MYSKEKIRTIFVLASIFLLVYPIEIIWAANSKVLYIYDDTWYYPPSGFMAAGSHVEALSMSSSCFDDPAEGAVCAKITWDPNTAIWAGFFVQASGLWRAQGGTGIDLSGFKFLEMKIRVDEGNLENMAGVKIGLGETGDSGIASLAPLGVHFSNQWQSVLLDLANVDLSDINGLLSITLSTAYGHGDHWPVWDMSEGIHYDYPKIYIDDIKFIGPGPAVITDLKVLLGSAPGSVNITWTAPEGDYTNASYIVKYSENYISNQIDFNNATMYSQSWIPGTPGSTESYTLTGLPPGQGYYFAVVTKDEQNNQSNISNSYYFIVRTSGIGILVESDVIDLGTMAAGDTKTGGTITVTNIGGINMTTSLSLTDPPGWIADSDNNAINQYVLLAAFGSSEGAIPWNVDTQVLFNTAAKSTTTRFAGDQTGENIPVDAIRKLYIRFTAPKSISVGTVSQTIFINISAESVD